MDTINLGIQRIWTTSYHPIASGLVDYHFVLLGIRNTLKQDLKYTPVELTYGTALRLSREFFDSDPSNDISDPTSYATRLKTIKQQI